MNRPMLSTGSRAAGMAAMLLATVMCAAQDDPLATLRERAERASGGSRARLYAELAREQVEAASRFFSDGELEQGHKAVEQAVEAAEKAGEAARTSRQRMRQTEISIRRTARRLEDIGRTLTIDDRPAVETAVESLEEVRTDILGTMFAPRRRS